MLIKICGLTKYEDVERAISLKIDFCGFIFHKKSPRYISPEKAAKMPIGGCARVGVFVNNDISEICRIMDAAKLDLAQLHGEFTKKDCLAIGPGRIIRVLWPESYPSAAELAEEIIDWQNYCAFYLLDAGKSGGGSGNCLQWKQLGNLSFPKKWLLAGGLTSENLNKARRDCNPDGFDLNSGVESAPGVKSHEKMEKAVKRIKGII